MFNLITLVLLINTIIVTTILFIESLPFYYFSIPYLLSFLALISKN
jgi:hypothetical protein